MGKSKMLIIIAILISLIVLGGLWLYFGILTKPDRQLLTSQPLTVKAGKTERRYWVYAPRDWDKSEPIPMVMALHGYKDNPRLFGLYTGFANIAEKEGFLLVLPEGTQAPGAFGARSWNAEICCDYAWEQGVDDIAMLDQVMEDVTSKYRIDKERRYITGFSNGAMMAEHYIATRPEAFSGAAFVAAAFSIEKHTIQTPIEGMNVLMINGQLDRSVPVDGGRAENNGTNWSTRQEMVDVWAKAAGCERSKTSSTEEYDTERFIGCEGGKVVEARLYHQLGHTWPGARYLNPGQPIASGSRMVWDFFQNIRTQTD